MKKQEVLDRLDQWASALESGEYKQGQHRLFNEEKDTYCCVGVLGITLGMPKEDLNGSGVIYADQDDVNNPLYPFIKGIADSFLLNAFYDLNDWGAEYHLKTFINTEIQSTKKPRTFAEIAAIIREHREKFAEIIINHK